MTEQYPWGGQAPAKRVAGLEAQIKTNDGKRGEALRRHREEIRRFDETDRGLKADLKVAQAVVEKEQAEANAAAASGVLMRLLKTSGVDLDEAIRSGTLESAMAEALAKVSGAKPKRAKASPAAGADASPSDQGGEAS